MRLALPHMMWSGYVYRRVLTCADVCWRVMWSLAMEIAKALRHTSMRPRPILVWGLAYLLLVNPSSSTRGPMSMMPRFSENERERAIIGIIECTVNLVGEAFVLVRFSFFFISSFPSVKTPWELGTYRGPNNFLERTHAFASAKKQSFFRK